MQLKVVHGENTPEFIYAVRAVSQAIPAFALSDSGSTTSPRRRFYRAEVFLTQGGRGYDIYGYSGDQLIADVINHYDRFRHYLYTTQ